MTDTTDAHSQAQAEAEDWIQQRAQEIAAEQSLQTGQASQHQQPNPIGPPPRQLVQELHARVMLNGAREEDAAAMAFNALVQRAKAGDQRFIVRDDGTFFQDGVDG